jgi:2-desacetyl-2-hydroxyethyl bacteriochlorophyllide A dehydrogenase
MPKMPLVQVHGVDDVRIDAVACPSPGPGDVLVRVAACGICGSDLGYISQGGLGRIPMPLGHELAGTVEACGERIAELAIGQRVTVNPMANGQSIGNGGSEGGFAPLLLVKDVDRSPLAVIPLPDTISFEQGALIEPLAVAMHGVHQSGAQAGQSVLVFGAGPIGLCTVIVLRHFGIDRIAVADRSDHRLKLAADLGARVTVNTDRDELAASLRNAHGEADVMGMPTPATDIYIEATGVGAVLQQCVSLARQGATITVLGVHKEPIELHPVNILIKELHLVGAMAYPVEFPQVIDMLSSGDVTLEPLISHHFPLDEFHDALAVARQPERAAKVMIDCTDSLPG